MQVSAHRRIERRELSGVFRVGNSFAEHLAIPKRGSRDWYAWWATSLLCQRLRPALPSRPSVVRVN